MVVESIGHYWLEAMNIDYLLVPLVIALVATGLFWWFSSREAEDESVTIPIQVSDVIEIHGNKIQIVDGRTLLAASNRKALVKQIEDQLGFTHHNNEEDVLTLLHNYAQFVQLLPASESHHHAHPGGLLDHTLEVAAIALRLASAQELPLLTDTEDRKKFAPAWRYGVLVASILHDIGKTISNNIVQLYESTEAKDHIRWHPDAGDMVSLPKYNWYTVSFHETSSSYTEHARLGWSLFNVIVPPKARTWIATADPRLIDALRLYLTGNPVEPFNTIIKNADSESTANNIKTGVRTRFASAKRQPIRELLMDNLREMLDSQAFTVGKDAGGEVFRFDGNKIFFLSKVFADKLRDHINAKGNYSVPQDNDRIFGILFEFGICLANPFDADKYTWNVDVQMKSGTHFFNGICFDANILYTPDMVWINEYQGKILCIDPNSEQAQEAQLKQSKAKIAQEIQSKDTPKAKSEASNNSDLAQQTDDQSDLAQPNDASLVSSTSESEDDTTDNEASESELSELELVELSMKLLNGQTEQSLSQSIENDATHKNTLEETNSVVHLSVSEAPKAENEPTNNEEKQDVAATFKVKPIAVNKINRSASVAELLKEMPKVDDLDIKDLEIGNAAKSKKPKNSSNKASSKPAPIIIPAEESAHAVSGLMQKSKHSLRPADLGQKSIEAMKLKFDVDEYCQTAQLSKDEQRNLAIQFFSWLIGTMVNENPPLNTPNSIVHVVHDGIILISPKAFHEFTGDDRPVNKDADSSSSPSKLVQQAFESVKMHATHSSSSTSGHFFATVKGSNSKVAKSFRCYWIRADKARTLFTNLPAPNPHITLTFDGVNPVIME